MLGRDVEGLRRELAESRALLLASRERRIPPGKDTKVLTSWNGLILAALATASRALRIPRYLEAAQTCAAFLLETLRQPDGRLLHGFKDGRARFNGYLEDYACLIDGLTRLFEADGNPRWVRAAEELAQILIAEFGDPDAGGFFFTGNGHEALIARTKDVYDNATPSGNAMAATACLRLGALTGRDELTEAGLGALRAAQVLMEKVPTAAGQSLIALDFLLGPRREVAVISGEGADEGEAALETIASRFQPHQVVAPNPDPSNEPALPFLADRPARDGRVTTYLCENFTCREPIVGVAALDEALRA